MIEFRSRRGRVTRWFRFESTIVTSLAPVINIFRLIFGESSGARWHGVCNVWESSPVRAAKSAEGVSAIHSALNASRASRTAVGHKNTGNIVHSEPRDFKLLLDCDVTKCIRVLFITIPSFFSPSLTFRASPLRRSEKCTEEAKRWMRIFLACLLFFFFFFYREMHGILRFSSWI